MHATYENSINMQAPLFDSPSSGPSFKQVFNNGQTPYINIFDARAASENHRSIIRAWPKARAASCSKAWLHNHTHRYLVFSRLFYCVFSFKLTKRRPLFLIYLSFRIGPILVTNIRCLRGIKDLSQYTGNARVAGLQKDLHLTDKQYQICVTIFFGYVVS